MTHRSRLGKRSFIVLESRNINLTNGEMMAAYRADNKGFGGGAGCGGGRGGAFFASTSAAAFQHQSPQGRRGGGHFANSAAEGGLNSGRWVASGDGGRRGAFLQLFV